MPNTPPPRLQGDEQKFRNNMKAWMPKRQNYANRDAYRTAVVRKILKFTPNTNEEFGEFLWLLPMGNRIWLYEPPPSGTSRNANTMEAVRRARKLLNPRMTNMLMWGKQREGNYRYAHKNFKNALQAVRKFPSLISTAKKFQDPNFMTNMYLRKKRLDKLMAIAKQPNNLANRWYNVSTPNRKKIIENAEKAKEELRKIANTSNFNVNVEKFENTVRGNPRSAAQKLLEIREKAARRTIARYVNAGKIGWHIRQLRKLREYNKSRGIGVSPRKRASSAPPVLSRSTSGTPRGSPKSTRASPRR